MDENGNKPSTDDMDILDLVQMAQDTVFDEARQILETMVGYKELRMMYACALKEVRTKFEVLDMEFNVRYRRNPISSIHTRLKSNQSIIGKMQRRRISFSLENLETHIQDVAGVRVVCSYVDDIYRLSESFLRQDDITLITCKDYINHPKPNGYRSLHLIVRVPVFFADQQQELPVEVQIRTIAMDFWASLEHQLKYKQDVPDQDGIVKQLRQCAQRVSELDEEMLSLRRRIEATEDKPSEDDILMEKLMRLDALLSGTRWNRRKRKGSRYRTSPRLPRTARRFRPRSMGRRSSSRQKMTRKRRKAPRRKKRRRNTQWRCTTM